MFYSNREGEDIDRKINLETTISIPLIKKIPKAGLESIYLLQPLPCNPKKTELNGHYYESESEREREIKRDGEGEGGRGN